MDEQKIIFAANLNRILEIKHKTQAQVADDIGISRAAMNMWCQGVTIPRMPKIQKLARYFHCQVSDLVDHHPGTLEEKKIVDSDFIIKMRDLEKDMSQTQIEHLLAYAKWYIESNRKEE